FTFREWDANTGGLLDTPGAKLLTKLGHGNIGARAPMRLTTGKKPLLIFVRNDKSFMVPEIFDPATGMRLLKLDGGAPIDEEFVVAADGLGLAMSNGTFGDNPGTIISFYNLETPKLSGKPLTVKKDLGAGYPRLRGFGPDQDSVILEDGDSVSVVEVKTGKQK